MAKEDTRSTDESRAADGADPEAEVDMDAILTQLEGLAADISNEEHREELAEAKRNLRKLPGSRKFEDRITKYTTRDVGEAAVGSIIFALPLLVEDGVFEIADHFLDFLIAGIPVFLLANIAFVIALTTGLLYAIDFREVKIVNPILGFIPRRLVGVLGVSFLVTTALMLGWGRLFADDPSVLGMFARITVIWAAAALGASLGDILPGESKGTDLTVDNLDDLVGGES